MVNQMSRSELSPWLALFSLISIFCPITNQRHFHQERNPLKDSTRVLKIRMKDNNQPFWLVARDVEHGNLHNCADIGTVKTHLLGPFLVLVLSVRLKQSMPKIVCLGWKPSIEPCRLLLTLLRREATI